MATHVYSVRLQIVRRMLFASANQTTNRKIENLHPNALGRNT